MKKVEVINKYIKKMFSKLLLCNICKASSYFCIRLVCLKTLQSFYFLYSWPDFIKAAILLYVVL